MNLSPTLENKIESPVAVGQYVTCREGTEVTKVKHPSMLQFAAGDIGRVKRICDYHVHPGTIYYGLKYALIEFTQYGITELFAIHLQDCIPVEI